MSPVSLMKVIDPGARVQVPFTLSVTRTCSGASNWEIHPTSRSPCATGLVSVTVIVETRDPVENAVPWTKVGVFDWATAGRGGRAPRVAITARPAVDRAERRCFMVTHSSATPAVLPRVRRERQRGAWPRSRVASCLDSDRRRGALSPPGRARPNASWGARGAAARQPGSQVLTEALRLRIAARRRGDAVT